MSWLWVLGALCVAFLALQFIGRHRQKAAPMQACATPPDAEPDAFAEFEGRMRSAFDFALLNSGYGSTQVWVTLRRAVKDIFLSIDDSDASPVQAQVKQLVRDLGQKYGLLVWAYDRHTPDDKNHLAKFVAAFAPRPWEGLLAAEPRHGLDCYHALPLQTGLAFLVVAKSGILMAKAEQDRIAEGLLWGALADMALLHYDTFGLEARNALDRLLDCGTHALLVTPGGFDAFAGPLGKLSHLLQTLQGEPQKELRTFVGQLKTAYGKALHERYGRDLPG